MTVQNKNIYVGEMAYQVMVLSAQPDRKAESDPPNAR